MLAGLTMEGRDLVAGHVGDVWGAVEEAVAVDEVLVYLLLDQEGSMVEAAVRIEDRWLRLQHLDDHLERPIDSRQRSRELVRREPSADRSRGRLLSGCCRRPVRRSATCMGRRRSGLLS